MKALDQKELLSKIHYLSGCLYLSDLHSPVYLQRIRKAMDIIVPSEYPIEQWKDAYGYITGEKRPFATPEDAYKMLVDYLNCECKKAEN